MALDWLFGSADKTRQLPNLSPEQMQAFQKVLGGLNPEAFNLQSSGPYAAGESYLQEMLSPSSEAFSRFSKPYIQQYQQEILPGIAAQYGGGVGAGGSSAFQNALASSATGLQTNLASLREQLRGQASGQALQYGLGRAQGMSPLLQTGLGTNTFQNVTERGQTGLLGQVGAGLAGGLGMGMGGELFQALLSLLQPQSSQADMQRWVPQAGFHL